MNLNRLDLRIRRVGEALALFESIGKGFRNKGKKCYSLYDLLHNRVILFHSSILKAYVKDVYS